MVTLGESLDHPIGGRVGAMARARDGTIYLSEAAERLPHVYASDGRFLRVLGRRGAGPGEYQSANVILVGPDQVVHIFDPVLGRHTSVTQHGKMIGSKAFPGGPSLFNTVLLPDGHVVTNHAFRDRRGAGLPLQELDAEGNRIRVFGDEVTYTPGVGNAQLLTKLFARSNGEIWAAKAYSYVLQLYSREGTKRKEYVRDAKWFEPLDPTARPSGGAEASPPSPEVTGIWEDTSGLVWTTTLVPATDWHPRMVAPRDQRYNTVIEVLDPIHGQLVTSLRVKAMVMHALPDGYLGSWREGPDGAGVVDVWQVHLRRP